MPRTSLDGRGRKNPEQPSKPAETPKALPASKSYSANLKESSPPKTNPWRRVKAPSPQLQEASASLDQRDWPRAEEAAATATKQDPVAPAAPKAVHHNDVPLPARAAHHRSASASPNSSREVFQAAAARAGESLWNLPFGADIWLYAEDKVLQVHRSVVAPKSGWIRDKLLPPHPVSMARGRDGPRRASQSDLTQNGAPVGVYFAGAAKIIGHSLKFMYTDPHARQPTRHHPCCVLFALLSRGRRAARAYHGDSYPRYPGAHVGKVEGLARPTLFRTGHEPPGGRGIHPLPQGRAPPYASPCPDVVAPLKLALAAFLDAVLPLIIQSPAVINLLSTTVWQRHSSLITTDLIEHRRRERSGKVPSWSLPSGQTLEALFEQAPTPGFDAVTCSGAGQLPDTSASSLQE
ncbi:hypothetical protein OCS_00001 [Ophiocordyceps sinensis CO18]|uniref:BTB domain-containing protein n=1 Tax=Ophiocordyceps sinensis (strain Co18 / CGMCC 3.14243) TaxID=911162 RepID=T5AP99_OPHSC|nr:hypothetical protein OCS_00001 [Ophiocordyceps sinensis CO18]